jgi:hypothetical protein
MTDPALPSVETVSNALSQPLPQAPECVIELPAVAPR